MRKKELLAAAVDRRADANIETAWCQMIKRKYEHSGDKYVYRYQKMIMADAIYCGGEGILQVSIWQHDDESGGMLDIPRFYLFISRTENRHLTYDLREEKWREAINR